MSDSSNTPKINENEPCVNLDEAEARPMTLAERRNRIRSGLRSGKGGRRPIRAIGA